MDETALITGGSKRIGREIAFFLASKGYNIALHYYLSKKLAEETAEKIREYGVKCELFQLDFLEINGDESLISTVIDKMSNLTILINNASVYEEKEILETRPKDFDELMAVNFRAPYFLSSEFVKKCSKGHIINLLDTRVARTDSKYVLYTITKKALADFTLLAAKNLAPNFRVNGIAPGVILPPEGSQWTDIAGLKNRIPLKKWGDPQFIIKAIEFLIDTEYVTGQIIYIDGGQHL